MLSGLSPRAKDVLVCRFGLGSDVTPGTLEEIGERYGITRERVRQIENAAISNIKKTGVLEELGEVFEDLKKMIESFGGVVAEEDILAVVSNDQGTKNHVIFLLVLGEDFSFHKEDVHFKSRWSVNHQVAEKVHEALHTLYDSIAEDDLVADDEIRSRFVKHLEDIHETYRVKDNLDRYLKISKKIACNKLGEWGRAHSSKVKTRGIKDCAYLVLRRAGQPMHFKEVAKEIEKSFGKKTHVATCHNELIKDKRFVLVGRGLYGLSEWGHTGGVVKEVIERILKNAGEPLTKEEVIKQVLKERLVKENTVLVNLQNKKFFKKTKDGLYTNL